MRFMKSPGSIIARKKSDVTNPETALSYPYFPSRNGRFMLTIITRYVISK